MSLLLNNEMFICIYTSNSLLANEDVVVVGGHPPVFVVIVLLGIVFLVLGEESIQRHTLLEVLCRLEALDVFQELEVSVSINTGSNDSLPVDALQLDVGVVLLEVEVQGRTEINVGALDRVHIITSHFKLIEVEVLWEDLHNYS